MDRNKPGPSGRTGKAKVGVPLHGSELFALGSKATSQSGRGGTDELGKSKVMSAAGKTTSSAVGSGGGAGSSAGGSGASGLSEHHRKRDASGSAVGSGLPMKKSKLSGTTANIAGGSSGDGRSALRIAADATLSGGLGGAGNSSGVGGPLSASGLFGIGVSSGGAGGSGGNVGASGSGAGSLGGNNGGNNSAGGGGNGGGGSTGSAHSLDQWEQIAVESDPAELVASVLSALEVQDTDTVVALVCGAIRSIIYPRGKPDQLLSLSLLYLAKVRAQMFCNETVTAALLSILRRDATITAHAPFKGRPNPSNHVLAANLLARGYHNRSAWPERFVRIYMDDAINERVWVDLEECASFVDNICTAFGTRTPPKSMLAVDNPTGGGSIAGVGGVGGSAAAVAAAAAAAAASTMNANSRDQLTSSSMDDDSVDTNSDAGGGRSGGASNEYGNADGSCPTQPRYAHALADVERMVVDTVRDLLTRRQGPDSSTRNLLRFLSATSGLGEVRSLASQGGRLEHWMHNGKLMKPAQELLTYLCCNVTAVPRDHDVLANLVKMRLKTKPLINIYMQCLREMIALQPSILFVVLKYVVHNELSPVRNPNNMGMLVSMFQTKPEECARYMAEIYHEFLHQREDCLRTLRVFLRELVKMLRYDMKLVVFVRTLLQTTPQLQQLCEKADYKDRVAQSMMDLSCLCMFMCVTPQIKEAQASLRSGRTDASAATAKMSRALADFYEQVTQIQLCALSWAIEVLPFLFKMGEAEFAPFVQKVLFMDVPEVYSKCE